MTAQQRVVLDACVLYPTVMRSLLLEVAARGLFQPFWSARLLEEWARAAARRGALEEMQARGEIALTRARFPDAELSAAPGLERQLWLPDENDIHVFATAVSASADLIVTVNAKDFPKGELAAQGVNRIDPDQFLYRLWLDRAEPVASAAEVVRSEAERIDGVPAQMRALLKKARLPRLAKALAS